MKNNKGFTLVELLAVIALLGIIMGIAIPGINLVLRSSKEKTFVSEANIFVDAAKKRMQERGIKYPKDNTEVTIFAIDALNLETGGKESSFDSPWDYSKSYVLVHNKSTGGKLETDYYIALLDEKGNGINLTKTTNKLIYINSDNTIQAIDSQNLVGTKDGNKNTGSYTFNELNNINTVYLYLGELSSPPIQYVNKTPGPNATPCQINGSDFTHFTDKRDTTEYPVTQIGTQCWMAADLTYTTSACIGATWSTSTYNACRINGSGTFPNAVHYQWDVANQVCPTGWRLPTDDEWKALEMYLGMSQVEADKVDTWRRGTNEGQKLKAITHSGTNTVGFNAMLTGYHHSGDMVVSGSNGYWWSLSASSTSKAWRRGLGSGDYTVSRYSSGKSGGYSVRCLLD